MRKLTLSEKHEYLGGASTSRRGCYASSSPSSKKLACYNSKIHNMSLLTLATIPGLIALGEELYNLVFNRKNAAIQASYEGGIVGGRNYYSSLSGLDHRRDFYAYASEAFRPSIRFSPYYYKSGITFALPWLK
ncbi:hypothetical protein [Candidatus Mycoplasma haematominutum]|uniref:Uncharacterized protein n=1 Tax=Candidatus Mycoplasma haematominutum 'Birmingham 1' TaxID=1116213 RepID=G8C3W1_9MOLU|nr:hypothetical protein [Candidatus Mycoplasma haematominutum]CCE67009.1 hypothetical protein (homolog to MSU_0781) [Candidatus Mycoplasma haematominutum 'Birmingham 1']